MPGIKDMSDKHRTFDAEAYDLLMSLKDPKNNSIVKQIEGRHSKKTITEDVWVEQSDASALIQKLLAEAQSLDQKGDKAGADQKRQAAQSVQDAYNDQVRKRNDAAAYIARKGGDPKEAGPYDDNAPTHNP